MDPLGGVIDVEEKKTQPFHTTTSVGATGSVSTAWAPWRLQRFGKSDALRRQSTERL